MLILGAQAIIRKIDLTRSTQSFSARYTRDVSAYEFYLLYLKSQI